MEDIMGKNKPYLTANDIAKELNVYFIKLSNYVGRMFF